MATDSSGNDLSTVSIPLTGVAAFAPVAAGNVIADTAIGGSIDFSATYAAYKKLGLYKTDGGPQDDRDDDDAIEFFQDGYKIAGDSTLTVQIGLAEDNAAVNQLITGKTPDANGVIYVDASLPDATFLLFVATRFKNGNETRRNGVARISKIEVDQEERGSVRGRNVTFEWVPSDLFQGKPFKQWGPAPVPAVATTSVSVSPTTLSVAVGATKPVTATTVPAGQGVSWSSDKTNIATVANGTVTGVAVGTATVTATSGTKTATVAVTVTAS